MENQNCRKCGKVFAYTSGYPLCNECRAKDETDYKRVREYLRENPKANILEVCKSLNMSSSKVMRYLKEGRLETSQTLSKCESCGEPISKGKLCNKCKG